MARWLWEDSVEDVTVRISETSGQDLTSTGVFLLARADSTRPEPDDVAWEAPASTQRAGAVIRATKLVTGVKVNDQVTKWWLWVKLVDNPEVVIAKAGFYRVR